MILRDHSLSASVEFATFSVHASAERSAMDEPSVEKEVKARYAIWDPLRLYFSKELRL